MHQSVFLAATGVDQLIFLAVALIAWGIKVALERKEAQKTTKRRPAPASS